MVDASQWLGVFGRTHPSVVHLPIGILVALAALEAVAYSQQTSLPRKTVSVLVWLAAASAVFAAASGYALSLEDGYGTPTVTLHMRLGIGVAVACVALALVHLRAREGTRAGGLNAYRVLLALTVLALLPTGHFGGTIAHGEGFLTGPLRQEGRKEPEPRTPPPPVEAAPAANAPAAAAISYARDIAPVLSANCTTCHGETKRKGGLQLHEPRTLVAGGRNGPVIAPGQPDASEMLRRLKLPADDEDHMPPPEKPQPTASEIERIARWIAEGAAFDVKGAPEWGAPSGDRTGATEPAGAEIPADAPAVAPPADTPAVAAADPAAIELLRQKLVHVEPLSKDSNLLTVSFSAAAKATGDAEAATLLEPLLPYVADLSLARSRITDETMKLVARMPNLARLDVRDTAISDAGVAALAGHPQLGTLVLARTHLTDAAVDGLLELPALKRVFVWNSGLGVQGLARLRLSVPDLAIEAGGATDAKALETEKDVVLTRPAAAPGAAPKEPAGSTGAVNATCPVSGKPVDPAYQVVYKGKVVGFCCANCPKEFWADPAKYESKLP